MKWYAHQAWMIVLTITLAACAPAAPAAPSSGAQQQQPAGRPSRVLVAAVRVEPSTVAGRQLRSARGVATYLSQRMFNADMALLDERGNPVPYLAEALPQLHTDGWRVFPDGRMETTYRIKPGLTWHDGAPLTAGDWVFGWQVYASPDWLARRLPFSSIDEVTAPDDHTVVIRWSRPYPEAGNLAGRDEEMPPLPRHLLGKPFAEMDPDAFLSHPFWNREFVGLGPYRVDRWEPGSFFEGVAFDGHVLGRPKIDRIRVVFISDSSTAVANMLAGEIHLAADTAIRLSQALEIRADWEPRGAGGALLHPNQWRAVHFQHRPEYQGALGLLDPRVRKALAHAIDKQSINEAVYGGGSSPADNMISPLSTWGAAAEKGSVKYPYDLRRSELIMNEAGYAKGTDGMYASPTAGRFRSEVKTNAASDNEAEVSIIANGWRQAGFDIQEAVLPAAQAQDNEVRSTFPGMYTNNTTQGESALLNQISGRIPGPSNRWSGSNRGGWSNAEYDRVAETFNTTLDRTEREELVARMVRIHTEDVGTVSLLFRLQPWVFASALKGFDKVVAPESNMAWNMHTWEFK
jgi:peptide/nickel transport system substrate-binding protein